MKKNHDKTNHYFEPKQDAIIKSWHNISINGETPYVKFFANWISFNAICYALFHDKAVKSIVNIDKIKKLPSIKSRLELERSINLKKGEVSQSNDNIKVKLEFPEELNLTIKERFIEHYIYQEFKKVYEDKIYFEDDDEYFIELKNSLKKKNGRSYVIDMSRIDQYDHENDFDKMSGNRIIKFCEDSKLSTIIDVLYQIRCNIFHGGKEPGDHHDDWIVKAASPVLNKIVSLFIYEYPEERISRIKKIIRYKQNIPKSNELFGGANLIITKEDYSIYDKDHNKRYPKDLVIRSKFCEELSWFVFELKEIYSETLDYTNKYVFYNLVGQTINQSFSQKKNIHEVISNTLAICQKWDRENPCP